MAAEYESDESERAALGHRDEDEDEVAPEQAVIADLLDEETTDRTETLCEEDEVFLGQLLNEIREEELADKPTDTCEAEECEELDGTWWPSSDQIHAMKFPSDTTTNVPRPTDWFNVEGPVHLCIDRARREGWEQCKREIHVIRGNVKKIPGIEDAVNKGESLEGALFNYLLGPTSDYGRAITTATGISADTYNRFLFSFMLSCQTNESIPALHNNQDIRKDVLLSTVECNRIWRLISKAGEVRSAGANRQDPLWKQVERIFNEQARQLFMSDDPDFQYVIAVDDDKVHFEWKRFSNTKGLKRCRHTKANARGFVVHTAGFPGCGAVVQVGWSQESDTDSTVHQRIVGGLFGVVEGGNNRPKIMNVEFLSDRGYWSIDLLFDYVLPTGAAVGGTLKRNGWIPFTYDKRKDAEVPDGQEVLPVDAYKNAYFKQVEIVLPSGNKRTLQMVAYRSGTGTSMSLVLSSKSLGKIWDLQTMNPTDHLWYHSNTTTQEERNRRAFELIEPTTGGFNSEEMANFVNHVCTAVDPRTCGQNTADWFLERMFALTSSTISAVIRILAPTVGPSHEMRPAFEAVLSYADLMKLLPEEDELIEESDEESNTAECGAVAFAPGDDPDDLDVPDEDAPFEEQAKILHKRMTKWPASCPNIQRWKMASIHIDVVKEILTLIKLKPLKGDKANRDKLMSWLEAERWDRPFMFLSKSELQKHPLFKRAKIASTAKVNDIKSALGAIQKAIFNGEFDEAGAGEGDDTDSVLICLLQKSFLKKEAAQDKHDARLVGQMNEPELLKKLWHYSQQDATEWRLPLSLKAVVHPGLVRQKQRPFLKSSADALIAYDQDGGEDDSTDDGSSSSSSTQGGDNKRVKGYMPVEIKTLVEMTKADAFKESLMANVGFNTHNGSKPHFEQVDADRVKDWLPNKDWMFQSIHQAATFNRKQSMFVVGTERRLLLGLFICYPHGLIDSFLSIVDWIYSEWLHLFYSSEGLSKESKEVITECLKASKLKRAAVDIHAFETSFGLWSRLNVNVQRDIYFPLPKTARIIPHVNSYWNSTKSPSDTTTKQIDSCDEKLGVRTPQTLAVARMIQLKQHQFFRAVQMLTAKDDLDAFYHSVRHYRDAASHRLTFSGSFERSKGFIRANIKAANPSSTLVSQSAASSPKARPKRGLVHTIKKIGHRVRAGITPTRFKQTAEQQALASRRNQECLGVSLVSMVNVSNDSTGKFKALKRKHCDLCNIMTAMYCTGCNRHLCVNKDRMEALEQRGHISAEDARKKTIKLPILNTKTNEMEHKWFLRSCYQIAHETQWEEYWATQDESVYCPPTNLFGQVEDD